MDGVLELTSIVSALGQLVLIMSCERGDLERHGVVGSLPIHTDSTDSMLYGMATTD